MFSETIELRVGENDHCVLVHEAILMKSPFFVRMLQKYPEKRRRDCHFPEFDQVAFATVMHWLHCESIPRIAEHDKADDIEIDTTHLVRVYCLCYKLELFSLANLAIEILGHGYMRDYSAPTLEEIEIAYHQTGDWSGIRFYMASWAFLRKHLDLKKHFLAPPRAAKELEAIQTKFPDLQWDLETWSKKMRPTTKIGPLPVNPHQHEICWYHRHTQDEKCVVDGLTFEAAGNGIEDRLPERV